MGLAEAQDLNLQRSTDRYPLLNAYQNSDFFFFFFHLNFQLTGAKLKHTKIRVSEQEMKGCQTGKSRRPEGEEV